MAGNFTNYEEKQQQTNQIVLPYQNRCTKPTVFGQLKLQTARVAAQRSFLE